MGILAEIDQAKISFNDPASLEIGFDTKRKFGYFMPSFEIQFGIRFDPDPAVGVGGGPATQENWRIGIIQNVLYARLRFETGAFATSSAMAKIRQIVIPELVRQFGTSIAILAYIPPFSLNFWADVDLAHFHPRFSFDDPNVTWGGYGDEGYFPNKPINRKRTGLGPNPLVKPGLGDGGRSPVITGSTSLMASRAFLQMHGLDIK